MWYHGGMDKTPQRRFNVTFPDDLVELLDVAAQEESDRTGISWSRTALIRFSCRSFLSHRKHSAPRHFDFSKGLALALKDISAPDEGLSREELRRTRASHDWYFSDICQDCDAPKGSPRAQQICDGPNARKARPR